MEKQTRSGSRKAKAASSQVGARRKRRSAGKRSATGGVTPVCTAEERHRMICEQAYFLAEQRGFLGDAALDDWLQAEAKVDAANILKAVVEDRNDAI